MKKLALVVALVTMAIGAAAHGATLLGTDDCTLRGPGSYYGSGNSYPNDFQLAGLDGGNVRYAVIKFDITGEEDTITSATLSLRWAYYVSEPNRPDSHTTTFYAYQGTADYSQSTVSWDSYNSFFSTSDPNAGSSGSVTAEQLVGESSGLEDFTMDVTDVVQQAKLDGMDYAVLVLHSNTALTKSFGEIESQNGFPTLDVTSVAGTPGVSTWSVDGSGEWSTATNWTGTAPDSDGDTAIFGDALTSNRTVNTDATVTVKNIRFDNAAAGYAIGGWGTVSLESDTAVSSVSVIAGSHQFQATVGLVNDATVNTATGAALAFNGALNLGGNTLTLEGNGAVAVNNDLTTGGGSIVVAGGALGGVGTIGGSVNVTGGAAAPGNSTGILTIDGDLSIGAGGSLDMEIDGLVAGDSHDQLVVTGSADMGGTLNIIGSFVPQVKDEMILVTAAEVTGSFDTVVGGDDLGGKAGLDYVVRYDADAVVLVASAHDGDATLDAAVNVFDLAILANNYNTGTGKTWEDADFTGDGEVNIFDLANLANNYGWSEGGAPVPEPMTLGLLAVGGLIAIRRRRK